MEQLVEATEAAKAHTAGCWECSLARIDSSVKPCDTGALLLIALATEYHAIEN